MSKSIFNRRDEIKKYDSLTLKYLDFDRQSIHYVTNQWCLFITLTGTCPGFTKSNRYVLYKLISMNLKNNILYRINDIDQDVVDLAYLEEGWNVTEMLVYNVTNPKNIIKNYGENQTNIQEFIRTMCWMTAFLIIPIIPAVILEHKKSQKKNKKSVSIIFTRDQLLI